jgi:hypothetical protein
VVLIEVHCPFFGKMDNGNICLPTLRVNVLPTFSPYWLIAIFTLAADPKATSIRAECNSGKISGWIVIRGQSLSGPSLHVQVASTSSNFSTIFSYPLNYSSFDLAAFVHPFFDKNQDTSVSLSSDEFGLQSLLIGVIGKFSQYFSNSQFFQTLMQIIQNTQTVQHPLQPPLFVIFSQFLL